MQRQRGELVPVGEVIADLPGPVQALIPSRPTQRHYTRFDAGEPACFGQRSGSRPGLHGAAAGAVLSLPRTNPGNRLQYKRVNGPFTLYMTAVSGNKLPYGNLPRLSGIKLNSSWKSSSAGSLSRSPGNDDRDEPIHLIL